jgi:hypothetical protein
MLARTSFGARTFVAGSLIARSLGAKSLIARMSVPELSVGPTRTSQKFLQISDGCHFGKSRFAQVNLVAVFKGRKEFHAIQRTEAKRSLKIGAGSKIRRRATRDKRDQFG